MLKIVEVTFPPTIGFKSGRVYSYITEEKTEGLTHAIVRDPRGEMILVKVVGVKPYARKDFRMKHIVKPLYADDIMRHLALKDM